jgi:hypothetical protein
MKKFEYIMREFPSGTIFAEDLNTLGSEGWEVCAVLKYAPLPVVLFKRELPPEEVVGDQG